MEPFLDDLKVLIDFRAKLPLGLRLSARQALKNVVNALRLEGGDELLVRLPQFAQLHESEAFVEKRDVGRDVVDGGEPEVLDKLVSPRFWSPTRAARPAADSARARPRVLLSPPWMRAR